MQQSIGTNSLYVLSIGAWIARKLSITLAWCSTYWVPHNPGPSARLLTRPAAAATPPLLPPTRTTSAATTTPISAILTSICLAQVQSVRNYWESGTAYCPIFEQAGNMSWSRGDRTHSAQSTERWRPGPSSISVPTFWNFFQSEILSNIRLCLSALCLHILNNINVVIPL